ncbi:hypothetical protein [Domibacillus sp. A3M-37]|uniref:hypothetical protein n=1 Tax=Domibacillus sp. A3M-37 TaxID=2962037 RepID=UPI0028113ABC|nr:hypothetical protein [Domibacillus sp. A3M-37]
MKQSLSGEPKDERAQIDASVPEENEKIEDGLDPEKTVEPNGNEVQDNLDDSNAKKDHDQDKGDNEEDGDDNNDSEVEDVFLIELTKLIGENVLIITQTAQLNLLGQTFRPIFCGPIIEVEASHLTIYPVTIKILNAPFFQFPTPLSIPLEKIAQFTPCFDCNARIPLA